MTQADFSSSFLSEDNTKENDIITIIQNPIRERKMSQAGTAYYRTVAQVNINGMEKTYSIPRATGLRFIEAWGLEMDNWLAKKATIKHEKNKNGKIEIEAYPLEPQKV